jgi:hypothetical protein
MKKRRRAQAGSLTRTLRANEHFYVRKNINVRYFEIKSSDH